MGEGREEGREGGEWKPWPSMMQTVVNKWQWAILCNYNFGGTCKFDFLCLLIVRAKETCTGIQIKKK